MLHMTGIQQSAVEDSYRIVGLAIDNKVEILDGAVIVAYLSS